MSFESARLHPVFRGNDIFYSVLEARRNLFKSFSDEYLYNLVICLGIKILICSEQETSFIRKFLPSETGPFWLLSEGDLLRLREMLLDSGQITRKRQRPSFENQFSPFAASNSFSRSQFMPWPHQGICAAEPKVADSVTSFSKEQITCSNLGLDSVSKPEAVKSGGEQHLEKKPSGDSLSVEEEGAISTNVQAPTSIATCGENKRAALTLTEEEMSPELRADFCEIRKFYTLELNVDRDGSAMQAVTIDKMFERIGRFLWYLRNVKNVQPELSCCSNPLLVQDFVNHMMQTRSLKAITCSRYITAFINVAKVPLHSVGKEGEEHSRASLEKIRSIQRQLERLARRDRVDELANKPQLDKIVYPELLELCRELKWEVQEKSGQSQARSCMDLCLLLLYCSANPGRSKEYITLRIHAGQSMDDCKNQNFICFGENEGVFLMEDAYKTRPSYGTNRTDLTPLTFLTYYLILYRTKMRPLLLNGKEHDFFFVNGRGDPFTQNSYSSYVSALFEKYFSLKVTTVDLRKAVVTHFMSLPESGDASLRESFATLMKHSVRTQRRFYDERPLAEKKSRALDFLSSMASRSLEEDAVEIIEDEDSEGNIEILPLPGDFVALVASDSTRSRPKCFLAKLLRLSEDHKTAFLAEFTEMEDGKFKLNAGKCFREALNAVIYPVDVVYLHSNGLYELRTSKIDIHNQVHKQ